MPTQPAPIRLRYYVRITKDLCDLASKTCPSPLEFLAIDGILMKLSRCQLPATNAHAEALRDYRRRTYGPAAGGAEKGTAGELVRLAKSVLESLVKEVEKKELILLTKTTTSCRLQRLSRTLRLSSTQRYLAAEAVRCLQSGSYRAAVVMGWSLAYDYVRHWAWKNAKRRVCFNKTLKTRHTTKAGSPVYPKGIKKYEDFFTIKPMLSESTVLETMKEAGLLSGAIHDRLCHYLRERNNFAHPNFRKPTEHKASAYIEDLLDLIADYPFKE